MNIKASYYYQMSDHKRSVCIYYFVIIVVFAALYISSTFVRSKNINIQGEVSGIEIATVIFVFISGLYSFKEVFSMLVQNGVSRKTMFISRILATLSLCFIMTVVDKIIAAIIKAVIYKGVSGFAYSSMFEQAYPTTIIDMSAFEFHLLGFLFAFFINILFLSIGFLITVLFYRLSKAGRVSVGISVPVVLVIVLPIVDSVLMDHKINYYTMIFFDFAFGLPSRSVISSIILFIIASILTWLLMRKAVLKN